MICFRLRCSSAKGYIAPVVKSFNFESAPLYVIFKPDRIKPE